MQGILKELLKGLPTPIQYVIVLGIAFIMLYLALLITRRIGEKRGDKITFDDPEAYDQTIPNPLIRKPLFSFKKKKADDAASVNDAEKDSKG